METHPILNWRRSIKMANRKSSFIKYFIIISVIVLLYGAIAERPSSYNTFLRWITCMASIFLTFKAFKKKIEWQKFAFITIAILFNPLFPIYLTHSTWVPLLNVLVAILFTFAIFPPFQKTRR